MRYAAIFAILAVILGGAFFYYTSTCCAEAADQAVTQTGEVAPPPKPLPIQVKSDKDVIETEVGTDLTSKKDIKEQEGLSLSWNGKDVPPLCFNKLIMGEAPLPSVDLATCGEDPELKVTKTYTHEGQLISNYRYKESEPDEPDLSIMYHVIGTTDEGIAVEVSSYTGGSGRFTGLEFVSIDGNTLKLNKTLGGGDRCNSGVADAEIRDGKLVYGFYITPGDFPMLATGDDQGLVAYEDLEASASSCFGIARYREGKLMEVELLPKAVDASDADWTSRYALQKCFNSKLKEQGARKALLPNEEFKVFVKDFLASCKKA